MVRARTSTICTPLCTTGRPPLRIGGSRHAKLKYDDLFFRIERNNRRLEICDVDSRPHDTTLLYRSSSMHPADTGGDDLNGHHM